MEIVIKLRRRNMFLLFFFLLQFQDVFIHEKVGLRCSQFRNANEFFFSCSKPKIASKKKNRKKYTIFLFSLPFHSVNSSNNDRSSRFIFTYSKIIIIKKKERESLIRLYIFYVRCMYISAIVHVCIWQT